MSLDGDRVYRSIYNQPPIATELELSQSIKTAKFRFTRTKNKLLKVMHSTEDLIREEFVIDGDAMESEAILFNRIAHGKVER